MRSRTFLETAKLALNVDGYSNYFQILYRGIEEYYANDPKAEAVDVDLFVAQLSSNRFNPKHVELLTTMVREAWALDDTSVPNVEALLLAAKTFEVKTKLSIALVNGNERESRELLDQYRELIDRDPSDRAEEGDGVEIIEDIDVADLFERELSPENLIHLYPASLNERVGGGVPPGTHILLFGRPESGKTALAITLTCGFLAQGKKTLYFGNEDPSAAIRKRFITALSGMDESEVRRSPLEAQRRAVAAGLRNLIIIGLTPGNLAQFEHFCEKYEAQCAVIDQLRNFEAGRLDRVNQLEAVATGARTCGKKRKMVVVSLTQAGDSAANKAVLEMGDVDFSNTGMPAQADIMLGVGCTSDLEARMERCISLPKNKNNGNHTPVYVRINPLLSRMTSL